MKLFIIICLLFSFSFANENTELLRELKNLVEQNGKKIEQNGIKIEQNAEKIDQNAKKIEQVDAKIDYMDKRLDFMQNIFYIILAGVFGVPLYMNRENNRTRDIIVALRELAQDDPKVQRSLKVAGLIWKIFTNKISMHW